MTDMDPHEPADLTVDELASLTSGRDPWHLPGLAGRGVPSYMVTDGPHGLRKAQSSDELIDLDHNVPATCFPPAAGLASSWDRALIRRVGEAIAEECVEEQVAVILGPGVNIKRNPLGGRSFEYWSEDPLLAGQEGAALVQGIQSRGVGACPKHFAANNQETDRLRVDARIGERALREIYLPAFETMVREAKPWMLMCSYNRVNGTYASQNRWLLTEVLRDEWGFDGVVVSDWGAVHDRAAALEAGLNLEMPPSGTDDRIVRAVADGSLPEARLRARAGEVLELVRRATPAMEESGTYRYGRGAHRQVARQAARESMVLLRNEGGLLPLDASQPGLAVIGRFADEPRYQGSGSSRINPTHLSTFRDALHERGIDARYAPGFTFSDGDDDPGLLREAVQAAREATVAVVFLGLPDAAESEGFDRPDWALPAKQLRLLEEVCAVQEHVAVVLSNGGAVSVADWHERVDAVVEAWLLGQEGGAALADVLFGDVEPTGRLAQSIPLRLEDDPSLANWPGGDGSVTYGEGVFVGYRHYDTFGTQVAYPFGFGLGYARCPIVDATVTPTGPNSVHVSAWVANESDRPGAQVVQVYVAPPEGAVRRPAHELRGFEKVRVEPGGHARVDIDLDLRAFARWSERTDCWHVDPGEYQVEVATSSRDIAVSVPVILAGTGDTVPLDEWSTLEEWERDPLGSAVLAWVRRQGEYGILPVLPSGDTAADVFVNTMPIDSLAVLMGPNGTVLEDALLTQYRHLL